MKFVLIKMVGIVYGMISIFILGLACLWPVTYLQEDFEYQWLAWFIYPAAVFIVASLETVLKYFEQKIEDHDR